MRRGLTANHDVAPVHAAGGTTGACWCGSGDGAPIATFDLGPDGEARLLRCVHCGTARLTPQPSEAALRRWYDPSYYGAPGRKFVGPMAAAVAVFQAGRARRAASYLPARGRVLDVGCGNGGFLRALLRRGHRVEGTELTDASAARVPAVAGVRVHVGDLLALDLPDGAYDLVTFWHVLEHVRRPADTLRRVHRLLAPGGRLLLSLPNLDSWQARLFGRHWFHHDPPRHLFAFGPRALRGLLDHTGFAVERLGTLSLEQGPFGAMQSALNALGLPRDRAYDVLKGLRPGRPAALLDLILLAGVAPPGLALAVAEAMAGRGGAMLVSARRRGG